MLRSLEEAGWLGCFLKNRSLHQKENANEGEPDTGKPQRFAFGNNGDCADCYRDLEQGYAAGQYLMFGHVLI